MSQVALKSSHSRSFFGLRDVRTVSGSGDDSAIGSQAIGSIIEEVLRSATLNDLAESQLEPLRLSEQQLILRNIRGGKTLPHLADKPRELLLEVQGTVRIDPSEIPGDDEELKSSLDEHTEDHDHELPEEEPAIEIPFKVQFFTTFHDFEQGDIRYQCTSEISGPIANRIRGLLVRHLFTLPDLTFTSIEFSCDIFRQRYLGLSLGVSPFVSRTLAICLKPRNLNFSAQFNDRSVREDADAALSILRGFVSSIAQSGIDQTLPSRFESEFARL